MKFWIFLVLPYCSQAFIKLPMVNKPVSFNLHDLCKKPEINKKPEIDITSNYFSGANLTQEVAKLPTEFDEERS